MNNQFLVAFKDNDRTFPVDSTGFNKIGVVTQSGEIVFEHRNRIRRRSASILHALPHDRKDVSPHFSHSEVSAYFLQQGLTPELFHLGLKWLLSGDAGKFQLPHRVSKHDLVNADILALRYSTLQATAQPGDLLLTFLPTSHFSRLICLVDGGPWSHAALVSERRTLIEAVTSGVREVPLEHYTAEPFRLGLFRPDPPLSDPSAAIAFARSQLGAKYSYSKALLAGTLKILRLSRRAPTPNDLALSVHLLPICRA